MCEPQVCVQSTGPDVLVLSNPDKRHPMQMSGVQHELFHSAGPSYNAALDRALLSGHCRLLGLKYFSASHLPEAYS